MSLPKNKLYTLLGIIAVILIAIGAITIFSIGYLTPSPVTISSEDGEVVKQINGSQINEEALDVDIDVNYNDLIDHNEQYVGKMIHYNGQIIEVDETDGRSYLIMATKKISEDYYEGNNVKVKYLGTGLIQGSIIDVSGEYRGLTWVEEGSENESIPLINAKMIEDKYKIIMCR
ncbi:hypothetical protein [Methanococcus voltae]|uniref:Uncharacterized protein n=2 Tax=Methanococcus voltae TaxID=2188 RepID=A0A8J7UT77_METVO|nr:hypothetical protein [Methanococcus voltae]MBP2172684.1 hypothetical protein [Methanococcus voltae]MBP2201399.1 hypothetical protein [Methanococcus voltae]MCS3922194.1 hypothetical protein [Methanococcus voltae PS]